MFVTVEGIDEKRRSRVVDAIAHRLHAAGEDPLVVREPKGTAVGDWIFDALASGDLEMSTLAEVFLRNAARAQLVVERIRPALSGGRYVLCEGYADATIAFAGFGRGLDVPTVRLLCLAATAGLEPELTILLDEPAPPGESGALLESVRRGYLEMAKAKSLWCVLDGTQAVERVTEAAWNLVRERVKSKA